MCPFCDSDETKVLETRKFLGTIYRRRQCSGCHKKFVSQENGAADLTFPGELRKASVERLVEARKARAGKPPKAKPDLDVFKVWG